MKEMDASTPEEFEVGRYPWIVLSVTSLGVLLMGINSSSLNVALPTLVRDLHATPLEANWILLAYMLVNTVLILVFGRLADILGRRSLYLAGYAVFTTSSLLLGFAPNAPLVIALRALQATGAASIITNTTVILTDVFPRRLISQALGLNVAAISVAQLIGPTVGGFVVGTAGWRWVFWFNVPLGALGLIWGLRALRHMEAGSREPMDMPGSLTVFLGLGGLLVALSEGGIQGWTSPAVIAGFLVFGICLPLFLRVEMSSAYPVVDLSLFRNWTYAMANLANFLNALTRTAPVLLVALYLQAARGESPIHAGLEVLPMPVGMVLASPAAGFASRRFSARLLATTGLGLSALGLLLLAIGTGTHSSYGFIGVGLALAGLGSGFFMAPNTAAIVTSVPYERRGVANGLRSMLQNTGMVMSTALSLAIVTGGLRPEARSLAYSGTLSRLSPATVASLSSGFRTAFLVILGTTLIAMVASYSRGRASGARAETTERAAERPMRRA